MHTETEQQGARIQKNSRPPTRGVDYLTFGHGIR
jgi:hypothetical protein